MRIYLHMAIAPVQFNTAVAQFTRAPSTLIQRYEKIRLFRLAEFAIVVGITRIRTLRTNLPIGV
jgi:hypothetical protein